MSKRKSVCVRNRENAGVLVLSAVLAVEFLFVIVSNLLLQATRLDVDMAMLYVHVIEMARNKTFLIPGWSYLTTLELDCPAILAVPLYALTGNIYLSYGISNLIFAVLLLWVLFQVFYGERVEYPLVSAILIFLPYRSGQLDYYNMLFWHGGQYIIKVTIPLLLAALFIRAEKRSGGKLSGCEEFMLVLYAFLTFLTGFSSGAYVLACGILPAFAGYFLYCLIYDKKFPRWYWIYGAGSLAASGAGILINIVVTDGLKDLQMKLVQITQFQDNLFSVFLGIFELFGAAAYEEVAVLSTKGIDVLVRMAFVVIILVCVTAAAVRFCRKKGSSLSGMLSMIFVGNMLVLLLCITDYGAPTMEYRYHLIGILPAMCLTAVWFVDFCGEKKTRLSLYLSGGVLVLAFLYVSSIQSFITYGRDSDPEQEVCDYVAQTEPGIVYVALNSDYAEIMRLLDPDHLYIYLTGPGGNTWAWDYYEKYVNTCPDYQDALLVVSSENDFGDSFEVDGQYFEKVHVTEGYIIYSTFPY